MLCSVKKFKNIFIGQKRNYADVKWLFSITIHDQILFLTFIFITINKSPNGALIAHLSTTNPSFKSYISQQIRKHYFLICKISPNCKQCRWILEIYGLNFISNFNILFTLDTLDTLPDLLISDVFFQWRISIWNVFTKWTLLVSLCSNA